MRPTLNSGSYYKRKKVGNKMTFLKRYGFLIYPLMYWSVYLTLRYLLTKSPDQSTEEFHTTLRRELVFIICSLGVYYFLCVSVTSFYEVLRLGILSTLIIHSALLIITLLVSLWNGKIVMGEVIFAQLMAARIILFFMPFTLFYYRER